MLKQRFSNILGGGKKKGILLFSVMGILIVATVLTIGATFGHRYEPDIASSDEMPVGETNSPNNEAIYFYADYSNASDGNEGVTITRRISPTPIPLQPIGISSGEGDAITEAGLRIELVSAKVVSNMIDVYFTLEDLTGGDRLRDGVFANTHVFRHMLGDASSFGGVIPNPIIDRSEDGVVTLRHRALFREPVSGYLTFQLFNDIRHNFRREEATIGLDLSAIPEQTPQGIVRGVPVLPHGLHDITVELEGFDVPPVVISGVGIIDGRLHIQTYFPHFHAVTSFDDSTERSTGWPPWLMLVCPQGEIVFPVEFNQFNYTHIDNPDADNMVTSGPSMPQLFIESVYKVDLDSLSEYNLVGVFQDFDWLMLESGVLWSTRFAVEPVEMEIVVEGLSVEFDCCPGALGGVSQITITPFYVFSLSSRSRFPVCDVPKELGRINLADGSSVGFQFWYDSMSGGSTRHGSLMVSSLLFDMYDHLVMDMYYPLETFALDLDSVVSIEIGGVLIDLASVSFQ